MTDIPTSSSHNLHRTLFLAMFCGTQHAAPGHKTAIHLVSEATHRCFVPSARPSIPRTDGCEKHLSSEITVATFFFTPHVAQPSPHGLSFVKDAFFLSPERHTFLKRIPRTLDFCVHFTTNFTAPSLSGTCFCSPDWSMGAVAGEQ